MRVPDWRHRGEYIRTRSIRKANSTETDIEPEWANEAYSDKYAVVLDPDPASKSGQSKRTIGWSETAGFLITVITIEIGSDLWGVNAFKSNDQDCRRYELGGKR